MADTLFQTELLMNDKDVAGACLLPPANMDSEEAIELKEHFKTLVFTPVQTHTVNVTTVESRADDVQDTDALITFRKDFPIGVFTADCVPILIYAPDVMGVAAVHAGWKGTLGGIVGNVVGVLESHGASVARMAVAFGPSISRELYEVDESLAQKFRDAGFSRYVSYPDGDGGKPHIDLQGVNVRRLVDCGVPEENIRIHPGCSFSTRLANGRYPYQSHRRSGGNPGRMLTCIMMRSSGVDMPTWMGV